jgi:hypothetical protein
MSISTGNGIEPNKAVTGAGPELDDNKTLSLPRKKTQ